MSQMAGDYLGAYSPPPDQRLGKNPMLPDHPATEAADSQYLANEAVMRAQIARQYADILQQLGYTDEKGNFIPGSVTSEAARAQADLTRSSDLAKENVTNESQRAGTLFSGYRGTATARAQYPYQQGILQLGTDVPRTLAQLHENAAGLIDQYTLQNNQLLAEAAQRRAALIAQSGGGTNAAIQAGGGTPPPPAGAPSAPTQEVYPGGAPTATAYDPVASAPFSTPEQLTQIANVAKSSGQVTAPAASTYQLPGMNAAVPPPKKHNITITPYGNAYQLQHQLGW